MTTISPASDAMLLLLPQAMTSVAVARRLVVTAALQAGMACGVREDLAVVVSELVTNAVRHAQPLPEGSIELGYRMEPDGVSMRVQVRDGGATTPPRTRRSPAAATGGRGLVIVARLADSWGVEAGETSTTVWALVGGATVENPRG